MTVREIKKHFESNGFIDGKNLSYFEDEDGEHNELSWQKRVPLFLKYLYGVGYSDFNI